MSNAKLRKFCIWQLMAEICLQVKKLKVFNFYAPSVPSNSAIACRSSGGWDGGS